MYRVPPIVNPAIDFRPTLLSSPLYTIILSQLAKINCRGITDGGRSSGLIGTAMTMKFRPLWKPIKPKRFAWTLGAVMGITCLAFRLLDLSNAWLLSVLGICFILTWLEAVLGFCVGCWMHSLAFGCEVCKLSEDTN